MNENKDTVYQNLWDVAVQCLEGNVSLYMRILKRSEKTNYSTGGNADKPFI